MSKPYDATTKRLIERRPTDWVDFLGLPPGPTTLLDADLSTVTASADRLIRVDRPKPHILHSEFESGKGTASIPLRLLQYSSNIKAKYGMPVVSTVFLLHKGSDSPRISGIYKDYWPDESEYITFRYRVVRIWEDTPERFLTGGLSLLPFAPIAKTKETTLPSIIARMEARIDAEVTDDTEAGDLWTATYVLMGLRYNKAFNAQLLQGVRRMKESVTYQAIIEEGQMKEARRTILIIGEKRFGTATPAYRALLEATSDLIELERLIGRLLEVESWAELLPTS